MCLEADSRQKKRFRVPTPKNTPAAVVVFAAWMNYVMRMAWVIFHQNTSHVTTYSSLAS